MKIGDRQDGIRQGIYSLSEAARFVRAHPATVRSWFLPSSRSGRKPVFLSDYPREGNANVISFADLVDVHVAARLRDSGVSMQHVRKVYGKLTEVLGRPHPFCYKKLYVHDGKVFVEFARDTGDNALVEVLSDQSFIERVMKPHLHRIEYDPETLMARRWRIADGILLDPRIKLGAPLVAGTRVPAAVLARAFQLEDFDAEYVAETYGVRTQDVENAVSFIGQYGGRNAA